MLARLIGSLVVFFLGCGGAAPTAQWPPLAPAELLDELDLEAEPDVVRPTLADAPDPPDALFRIHELDGLLILELAIGADRADDPLPAVWLIHGRGDRARIPGGPFYGIERPIRLFVPQAPTPLGAGFTWLSVRVAEDRPEILARDLVEMSSRLAEVVTQLTASRPTIGRPILTGFSQGGLLGFALATLHPHLFSTVFPHAGWLPPTLGERALLFTALLPPIRATHGEEDDRVPFGPTEALVSRLREAGADIELRAFPGVGHTMSEGMDETFSRWLDEAIARLLEARGEGMVVTEEGGEIATDLDVDGH